MAHQDYSTTSTRTTSVSTESDETGDGTQHIFTQSQTSTNNPFTHMDHSSTITLSTAESHFDDEVSHPSAMGKNVNIDEKEVGIHHDMLNITTTDSLHLIGNTTSVIIYTELQDPDISETSISKDTTETYYDTRHHTVSVSNITNPHPNTEAM